MALLSVSWPIRRFTWSQPIIPHFLSFNLPQTLCNDLLIAPKHAFVHPVSL